MCLLSLASAGRFGQGDAHLIGIARTAGAVREEVLHRPYADMNGHLNGYSAYNADGSRRGAAYTQKWLKQAFRRTYIIMHGGTGSEDVGEAESARPPGRHGRRPQRGALPRAPEKAVRDRRVGPHRHRLSHGGSADGAVRADVLRVKLLIFFDGKPGTVWNLARKPKSLAAYKRYVVPFGR